MAVKLRAAKCRDSFKLARLDEQSRPEAWSERAIHDVIAGRDPYWRCYVAMAQGELVGFVLGRIIVDEAELDAIVVGDSSRRTGVGSALLRHFEREAFSDGASVLVLEVRAANGVAKRFYASHHYEQYRTRKSYYADGEDAVCLRRRLECETAG